ncbi:hypothetical protein OSB04_028655 [Centaurea solstitialis]|uniref:CCHC-type domain-containing protein n=1 Tax=Centaurea solstitialis TaxID=347529 RepID=A0AA38W9H0_9ASTR|nr:hypothetical protein OSB04_028655 [Centaurea solstitialis]
MDDWIGLDPLKSIGCHPMHIPRRRRKARWVYKTKWWGSSGSSPHARLAVTVRASLVPASGACRRTLHFASSLGAEEPLFLGKRITDPGIRPKTVRIKLLIRSNKFSTFLGIESCRLAYKYSPMQVLFIIRKQRALLTISLFLSRFLFLAIVFRLSGFITVEIPIVDCINPGSLRLEADSDYATKQSMESELPSENLRLMNQDIVKLDRFDGQNYTRWVEKNPIPAEGQQPDQRAISDLEKQRLLRKEAEALCLGHIKNTLSDRLFDLYSPISDPRELWKALEQKYKTHEEGTNKYLVFKYLEFQMVDDKPIMEQVHELQVLVNKLNALSIPIVELFQVGAIIAKLPPSWKDFSKRMMHKSEDFSLDDLMKHLRIEEETRIRDKRGKASSNVHHVTGSSNQKNKQSWGQNKVKNFGPKKQSFKRPGNQKPKFNNKPKKAGPCHVCGETGHYARECKDRKSGPVANAVDEVANLVANVDLGGVYMISSLTRAVAARGWFVDTGATIHVCGQRRYFSTYRPAPAGTVVVCADGHRADVLGIGDVTLRFKRGRTVVLTDALHVPTISKGLVSADKFDKGGFKMVLENG